MTGGLVQDYSKSPIKTTQAAPPEPATGAPAQVQYANQQETQPYTNIHTPVKLPSAPLPVDLSAPPPKKTQELDRPAGSLPPQPMGQQHDRPDMAVPVQPVSGQSNAYTPAGNGGAAYGQQATTPYAAQTSYMQNGPNGYQQDLYHNGASTDYGKEGSTNMEYAEQTWKSATKAVSEYTSTAGEVAGKTLGSIKGWLNPESKGLR